MSHLMLTSRQLQVNVPRKTLCSSMCYFFGFLVDLIMSGTHVPISYCRLPNCTKWI